MRAVVQRVSSASIRIDGTDAGSIAGGVVILLGVDRNDTGSDAEWLAHKCAGLRIFEDADNKMNRSLIDTGGDALIVSQFTLFGNVKKGFRPSFNHSAPPDLAIPLYERFVHEMRTRIPGGVLTGKFAAYMEVSLVNDGPVTIVLDSQAKDY